MKKICILCLVGMMCVLSACGKNSNVTVVSDNSTSVDAEEKPVLSQEEIDAVSVPYAEPSATNEEIDEAKKLMIATNNVDVDLSALDDRVAYVMYQEIEANPSAYLGKTFKIKGKFVDLSVPDDNLQFYMVMMSDEEGQFVKGVEVSFSDGKHPSNDTEVTVIGTFEQYKADGTRGGHYHSEGTVHFRLRDVKII